MKKPTFFIILFTILFAGCTTMDTSREFNNNMDTTASLQSIQEEPLTAVIVNIEGIIAEVSKDGKSFMLSDGKWVITDRYTEMGITGPTAAPKEDQYFEPSFRVGNSVAGFSETPEGEIIVAYAIYTNWNWDNPIR